MRAPRTFLLLTVIVAVLLMAVAYAAISNVTLNVTGNVVATGDQGNFKVAFSGAPTYKVVNGNFTPAVEGSASGLTARIDVSGMKTRNDEIELIFPIKNSSTDIYAYLSWEANITNSEYFEISEIFKSNNIESNEDAGENVGPGNIQYVHVCVKLIKTPIEDVSTKITINVEASPTYETWWS